MASRDLGLALLIGALALGLAAQAGWIKFGAPEQVTTPTQPTTPTPTPSEQLAQKPVTAPQVPEVKTGIPIETLKAKVIDKYTSEPVAGVQLQFWAPGTKDEDVANTLKKPLDVLTTGSDGVATSTNMIIQTGVDYVIYFNGSTTYYDDRIEPGEWVINYNERTGKGYLLFYNEVNGQKVVESVYRAVKVGAFISPDTLPETSQAVVDTGTNEITYNKTTGGGTFWFKMDIGNGLANTELKDVVLCFMDTDGDMDGDEITAFTASYVSGSSNIKIPGSLIGYWKQGMGAYGRRCVKILAEGVEALGSAENARWKFDIAVVESNWADDEEFQMAFDDLGDFGAKEYPSASAKAAPVTLTIKAAS